MTSWTESPLAAFDLETTGPIPTKDRIVTACLARIDGKTVTAQNWLVDPEIDIPEGASNIHGVTTDRARAEGAPYADGYQQIRDELERVWAEGRIVCAFNGSFDFTMIDREGQRLGYPKLVCGPIFDPYVVDKAVDKYRKGKRQLSVMCAHYEIKLENAHSADADALAAARLAWVLGNRNRGLAKFTVDELMEKQTMWRREQQESLAEHFASKGQDVSDINPDWPIQGAA
ncbi:exonuclease domain-containing protein [Rhodococcus sp. IEGM 1379]|uniref:exonuclease domain-containing protein n=1 Tax=Rhodococcus sp. IEGM 1379 TaxID=3047086 RepID=UPI0024B7BCE7|nr:exonuclease domain-containing protein [Rhodococcus sp. IEGM 1379]MDI9914394.1 exonuclease domain-containing protein [Rhodococcus sp. IEGM 1379]